jgi:NTE family protein
LVLAGGGARGAYEAGALSVLLPELEARGERPQLLVGTSVGAINAAFAGASAHLPAEQAVAIGLERWRAVRQREVVRSILGWQAPITALRYAAQVAGVPGIRLPSLLDPAPLVRNLRSWIDWQALHANVEADRAAVVVVATAIATGRSVAFAETHELKTPRSRRVMYVNCRIELEHVRASAAIPILFPPVHVESPRSAAGWYVDGGTRLNTPIKPAIDLGADRLVVLATDALSGDPRPATDGKPPDFGDGALHLLQGMLIDPLIEDLRTLGEINLLLASAAAPKTEESLIDFRAAGGKHPYRPLPCLLVAPREPGAIGRLAADVFHRRSRAQLSLSGLDIRVLDRLLGTDTATHGDLLSYLLFDPDFISELIAMGGDDARAALGKWTITPPPRGDAEPAGHPAFGR